MCKVISLTNSKGGVGKTCLAVNLGIGFAREGKRVLIIDADSQGSATISLGFSEPDRMEVSLATVLGKIINDEEIDPTEGILIHSEGVHILPGNIELAGIEVSLVNIMSRELILRQYIQLLKPYYDVILIDCMPSLGMITINALACSDACIIPVQSAYLPVRGLEQLMKTISKVKRQINPALVIEGIAITMVDYRTNYAKEITELLTEAYGDNIRIFKHKIPMSVRVSESSVAGCSIYQYDPRGKATAAFEGLTREVLYGAS